jgi:tetratricopeptide (TPR) repeat protein
VNLSCGLLAAAVCALATLLARRAGCSVGAALGAGWLLGLADAHWAQGVVAEVYGATTLAVVATLFALRAWRVGPTPRRLGAAAAVAGLSLGLHPLARGLLPLFGLFVLAERPRTLREPRALLAGLLGLALGLLPFLYLPIRSATNPFLDWGDPQTPSRFLDHVLLRQYTDGHEGASLLTWASLGKRFDDFLPILTRQLPLPVLALAAGGAWVVLRRERTFGVLLVATAGTTTLGIVLYTAARDPFFFPSDFQNYCAPGFALLGLLAGFGLDGARSLLARAGGLAAKAASPACAVAALALSVWTHAANRPRNDRSADRFFEPWGRALLQTVGRDGALLAYGDHFAFPCLFLQRVLGFRTDVLLPRRGGTLDELPRGASEAERARRAALLGKARLEFNEALLVRDLLPQRAVYVTDFRPPSHYRAYAGLERTAAVPVGLLYRVVADDPATVEEARREGAAAWAAYGSPEIEDDPADRARRGPALAWRLARGLHEAERGDADGAAREFAAMRRNPLADASYLSVASGTLTKLGRPRDALPLLETAVERSPGDPVGWRNLGTLLESLGRSEEAVRVLEALLAQTESLDAGAFLALGRAHRAARRPERAVETLRRAASTHPADGRPLALAADVLLRDLGRREDAIAALEEAVRREPGRPEWVRALEDMRRPR